MTDRTPEEELLWAIFGEDPIETSDEEPQAVRPEGSDS